MRAGSGWGAGGEALWVNVFLHLSFLILVSRYFGFSSFGFFAFWIFLVLGFSGFWFFGFLVSWVFSFLGF